jgi:hypothetical protein
MLVILLQLRDTSEIFTALRVVCTTHKKIGAEWRTGGNPLGALDVASPSFQKIQSSRHGQFSRFHTLKILRLPLRSISGEAKQFRNRCRPRPEPATIQPGHQSRRHHRCSSSTKPTPDVEEINDSDEHHHHVCNFTSAFEIKIESTTSDPETKGQDLKPGEAQSTDGTRILVQ